MSGVWMFQQNGVVRLVENPKAESNSKRGKVLVHLPSDEVITCYSVLERELMALGWERYYHDHDPSLIQYHMRSSIDLISLPKDFSKFRSVHMYDIVVKTRNVFLVKDM